jgi:hypothetical protein
VGKKGKESKMKNKSILDEILSDSSKKDLSSIKEEDAALEPLLDEINMIKDHNVKSFIRSVLLKCNLFWIIPSSFSGKYHPSDEHGPGGNVLHTKRVVRAASVLADSYSLSDEDRDLVYAACLLHDITKGVITSEEGPMHYDPLHPYTVGGFVKDCQREDRQYASEGQSSTLFLSEETVQSILRLVRCHLGPWSPVPETTPITYLDMIVHLADNLASKVHYVVDGEKVVEDRWKF